MRQLRLDLRSVIDALERSPDEPTRHYLDLQTGEVMVVVLDDFDGDEADDPRDEDPERYLPIPAGDTRDAFRRMERFADAVEDTEERAALREALDGRGAFSRFRRYVFESPDLRRRWDAHVCRESESAALAWLEGQDILPEYDPLPVPVVPDRPTAPQDEIDLVDLLLLGGPDGKTEVLGGAVLRVLVCRTTADATKAFRRLARQICELVGEPWRRRYVEGATAFEKERFRLAVVDGTRIELRVRTSPEKWRVFA